MPVQCRTVDLSFLENAPEIIINIVEIAATPEQIFATFEDAQAWPKWFKGIQSVEWTSKKPYGVGTTRTVSLGALKVWEHFDRWEHNKGFSFHFTQTSLPFVKALMEDYQLEVIDEKHTRFIYTVAYQPSLMLKLSGSLGRTALRRNFGRAAKALVGYMEKSCEN
jgi:hypothetical protein